MIFVMGIECVSTRHWTAQMPRLNKAAKILEQQWPLPELSQLSYCKNHGA